MRKLLMASAAILGASGGLAHAQVPPVPVTANPNQGQLAAPYGAGPSANNNNNAWGVANTPTGSAAAGPLSSVIYPPNVDAVPAPGTVVIRLNVRVESDVAFEFTNLDKGLTATGAPTGYKISPIEFGAYFRIYPGFDGLAANGLRYGAAVEIRENFGGGTSNNGTFANGLTGPGTATGAATGPSTTSSQETLFVRRAFTYVAADQIGLLRLGQTDGVIGLFDPCIFTTQCWDAGIGQFNGGGGTQEFAPTNQSPPFVWLAQAGAEYDNDKVVYLSPQFYGFDFGVQYAPNQGSSFQQTASGVACGQAAPNCEGLTSGNDATRWINQVGFGLRYQQAFGPVDFKAYGFYETSGKENLSTSAYSTTNQARLGTVVGGVTSSALTVRYDDLSFYKAGVAVTAFNVTAAADYIGGRVNGQLALDPTGGAPTNAVVTGLTYANGPLVLGAEVGLIETQGDARLVGLSQRHQYEVAFGGAYKLAPGFQVMAEYLYEYSHQGGYDFHTGALGAGATATTLGRTADAQGQGVILGTVLTW
jgi:hypothetical protein